jgi:hypothetical protein
MKAHNVSRAGASAKGRFNAKLICVKTSWWWKKFERSFESTGKIIYCQCPQKNEHEIVAEAASP